MQPQKFYDTSKSRDFSRPFSSSISEIEVLLENLYLQKTLKQPTGDKKAWKWDELYTWKNELSSSISGPKENQQKLNPNESSMAFIYTLQQKGRRLPGYNKHKQQVNRIAIRLL